MFLSTPPSRVATVCHTVRNTMVNRFYPRHPRGWRQSMPLWLPPPECFYPRHPRGWRPLLRETSHNLNRCFYPRHPRGWRRAASQPPKRLAMFLSTPPSRVATRLNIWTMNMSPRFYPRHPRGWRHSGTNSVKSKHSVSIHATLAGGDLSSLRHPRHTAARFYPRHPRGWRLHATAVFQNPVYVSIHATLAGGD